MERFFKFRIRFWIFGRKPEDFQKNSSFWNFGRKLNILSENRKIFERIARREYWSNCNVLYINDSSWQALQTDGKLFFQISNLFSNYWLKIKKYSTHNKVGFMQARWGRHLCWSARLLVDIHKMMQFVSFFPSLLVS